MPKHSTRAIAKACGEYRIRNEVPKYPPDEVFDFLLSKILAPRERFRITSQGTIAERLLYLMNDRVAERVGFEFTQTPIEISKFMKNLRRPVPCRPLLSPAFSSTFGSSSLH